MCGLDLKRLMHIYGVTNDSQLKLYATCIIGIKFCKILL